MYEHDSRVVMTLDAGGTNFVFSAMRGGDEIVSPIRLPAVVDDLGGCLESLVRGFSQVKQAVSGEPVAISFAFPGPADYGNGIIGDLPNFPAFRGGVALGPFLSQKFGIPVYINNDGNLYAYGEALSGMLPAVNRRLEESGSSKRYSNLIGITLGTGFGAGVVIDGRLLSGDNGCGGDVWLMRNKKYPDLIAEESVSIRAVKRVYAEKSGCDASALSPKEIFDIAEGTMPGDRRAAVQSFEELGEMAGDAIVRALDIVDGLVVFGGGISGAAKYIIPGMIKEMNRPVGTFSGMSFPCLQSEIYDLSSPEGMEAFLEEKDKTVKVPFSDQEVRYACHKKTGIAVSFLGASRAIALGAYSFALSQLDNHQLA